MDFIHTHLLSQNSKTGLRLEALWREAAGGSAQLSHGRVLPGQAAPGGPERRSGPRPCCPLPPPEPRGPPGGAGGPFLPRRTRCRRPQGPPSPQGGAEVQPRASLPPSRRPALREPFLRARWQPGRDGTEPREAADRPRPTSGPRAPREAQPGRAAAPGLTPAAAARAPPPASTSSFSSSPPAPPASQAPLRVNSDGRRGRRW